MQLTLVMLVLLSLSITSAAGLEDEFRDRPDSAKPWTYWWWLYSNVSKAGITADLEAMKEQGIAGALVFDAGKLNGSGTFFARHLGFTWEIRAQSEFGELEVSRQI